MDCKIDEKGDDTASVAGEAENISSLPKDAEIHMYMGLCNYYACRLAMRRTAAYRCAMSKEM